MNKRQLTAAALWIALAAQPVSEASAAAYVAQNAAESWSRQAVTIQYAPDKPWRPGPHVGPGPHVYPGVRAYPGWRGQPGWRGAPAWRGPPGWAGRPYWYGRPWVRRPYYGTIIAGIGPIRREPAATGTTADLKALGKRPGLLRSLPSGLMREVAIRTGGD